MAEEIKRLNGHSGSTVSLMKDSSGLFIRKTNNVSRNYERISTLNSLGYSLPKLLKYSDNILDMEYIQGLDMKTYLIHNNTDNLSKFILSVLNSFSKNSTTKDYSDIYEAKLNVVKFKDLPFSKNDLLDKLPVNLPSSTYHGDFTLENLLYSNSNFYMIDAVTIEYDSYIFDIAKLRQDLSCGWFLRHTNEHIETKLINLESSILDQFPEARNNALLILMLLRVFNNCIEGDFNYKFLLKHINRLWTFL